LQEKIFLARKIFKTKMSEVKKMQVNHLTEEDVKNRYITPALEKSGWQREQMKMEYAFTDGQILVTDKKITRGKINRADYLLLKNETVPLAIVEAKNLKQTAAAGLQQAMNYAEVLNVPFAYSSNGKNFVEHDFLTGKEKIFSMSEFPSEAELWERFLTAKKISAEQEKIILTPDYVDAMKKIKLRYYQRNAIDRTVQAVANGQKRILLVMATGTGKTLTAFQIIWKLLQAGKVNRVLYLADRNILIDQTMQQDFSPLKKIMCKVQNKKLDSSYKIFMSLYHQLVGEEGEEAFRQFKPEFFDLIIVDECHRGSAKADSEWRKILDYFNSAIHIGLTATPKETKEVSSITYFGEPIYTYSLKQGILDGFLAPYKIIRVNIDKDLEGWKPYKGMKDLEGKLIPEETFYQKDFGDRLFIEERTKLVAQKITEWLKENGRFNKAIVFCKNQEHAEIMRRALINENADLVKDIPNYVMKITGDDAEGKKQLDYFIEPDATPPIIATTAELLTTGVDCKTVKLIVIDKEVESMITFKQIIGRGTRLRPDYDKNFFTIMDFRGATKLFADEDFDGEPLVVLEDKDDDTGEENSGGNQPPPVDTGGQGEGKKKKFYVRDVEVSILNESIQFIGRDGKLITENLIDYSRKNILGEFPDLKIFLQTWNQAEKKQVIIEELEAVGVFFETLREFYKFDENIDDFDLILNVAYNQKTLTRQQRVKSVRQKNSFENYPEKCRQVISVLLEKYSVNGIKDLENLQVLKNDPFPEIGSQRQIVELFGGKDNFLLAVNELKNLIYQAA